MMWERIYGPSEAFYFNERTECLFFSRERERKRGRETSMCGCLSCTPNWGHGPQPRHVPWLGIEPVTLWFLGQRSVHWLSFIKMGKIILVLPTFHNCYERYTGVRHVKTLWKTSNPIPVVINWKYTPKYQLLKFFMHMHWHANIVYTYIHIFRLQ